MGYCSLQRRDAPRGSRILARHYPTSIVSPFVGVDHNGQRPHILDIHGHIILGSGLQNIDYDDRDDDRGRETYATGCGGSVLIRVQCLCHQTSTISMSMKVEWKPSLKPIRGGISPAVQWLLDR